MKRGLQIFCASLAVVVVAMTITTASAGGADKVVICHHNQDDPDEPEWVTITVAAAALPAHLAHGDIEGACVVTP